MLKVRTQRVEDNGVWLEVSEATVLTAMRRWRLIKSAEEELAGETDPNVIALRTIVYPSLAAAVTNGSIELPLSFKAFLWMREGMWDKLYEACKELNPHWFGEKAEDDPNA